jgi:hypothetical protein
MTFDYGNIRDIFAKPNTHGYVMGIVHTRFVNIETRLNNVENTLASNTKGKHTRNDVHANANVNANAVRDIVKEQIEEYNRNSETIKRVNDYFYSIGITNKIEREIKRSNIYTGVGASSSEHSAQFQM